MLTEDESATVGPGAQSAAPRLRGGWGVPVQQFKVGTSQNNVKQVGERSEENGTNTPKAKSILRPRQQQQPLAGRVT